MTYAGTGPSGIQTLFQTDGQSIPLFKLKSQTKVLSVGKDTSVEFSSIKTAVDSVVDSSSSNRYFIDVGPGTYVEGAIVLPTYVNIRGTPGSTVIVPSDNNSPLISMSGINFISSIELFTPSNSIGLISTNGAITNIDRLLFFGPNIGIKLDTGTTIVGTEVVFNYLSTGTSGICILSDNVTSAIFSTVQIVNADVGIRASSGKFTLTNYTIKNTDIGVIVGGDTISDLRLGNIDTCQTGICVLSNTVPDFRLIVSDTDIRNSVINDFETRAMSGIVNVTSSSFSQDKLVVTNFDTINMVIFDEKEGE
ncbi:unnamed protein product, partial [marine sediment metagenome]